MKKEFTSHSTFTLNGYVVYEGESDILEEFGAEPKRQKKK